MPTDTDLRHLHRCIELAAQALEAGDEPFGSVLVAADGRTLAEGRNRAGSGDPTRHPEFELARWAAANLTADERAAATVYTSGEHCPMCSAAHGWVGLGRIVYASSCAQLAGWLAGLGVPASPVRALPIQQVLAGTPVEGPVPGLAEQVHELHRRFQDMQQRKDTAGAGPAQAAAAAAQAFPMDGGCDCGAVRYRMATAPLFVHACHCRWCQRESGSAFALNALIESDRLAQLALAPELVRVPSESGRGQAIARCPQCKLAVWSHYAGAGPRVAFVRVGTLERPDLLPPDIHIFTQSRQPWVILPPGTPAVPGYYRRESYWPAESLARWHALQAGRGTPTGA